MKDNKTVEFVLDNWEKFELTEWFAVDEFHLEKGIIRLFVTDDIAEAEDLAAKSAIGSGLVDWEGNPCLPGEIDEYPFFRMVLIRPEEAREYFEAGLSGSDSDILLPVHKPEDSGKVSAAEASKMLGISRQRVGAMCSNGTLDAEKVGKYWVIERASVEARMANTPKPGRPWQK